MNDTACPSGCHGWWSCVFNRVPWMMLMCAHQDVMDKGHVCPTGSHWWLMRVHWDIMDNDHVCPSWCHGWWSCVPLGYHGWWSRVSIRMMDWKLPYIEFLCLLLCRSHKITILWIDFYLHYLPKNFIKNILLFLSHSMAGLYNKIRIKYVSIWSYCFYLSVLKITAVLVHFCQCDTNSEPWEEGITTEELTTSDCPGGMWTSFLTAIWWVRTWPNVGCAILCRWAWTV